MSISGNPKIENLPPQTGRLIREDNTIRNVAEALYEDPDGNTQVGEIEVLHVIVHQRKMFTISSRHSTPQNEFHRMLLTAPADKDLHARIAYSSEDFALFNTYEQVENVVGGVAKTAFNRVTGQSRKSVCLKNITSFTQKPGVEQRGEDFVGSAGSASQRAGGTGAADIETIIKAGTNLLLELQRTDVNSKYTGFIINFYERSPLSG